jgi:endonuclease I/V8-like Glu-specific endopeptidase
MEFGSKIRATQLEAAKRWAAVSTKRSESLATIASGHSPDSPERQLKAAQRVLDLAPTLMAETTAARVGNLGDWLNSRAIERTMDVPDFESPAFLEVGLAVGRAVCLVEVHSPGGGGSFKGTGFLVAPGVMLTNNHVLRDKVDAANATITFDYQNDGYGKPLPQTSFCLDPASLFITDILRDCSLVAVGPQLKGLFQIEEFGWLPLVGAEGKVEVRDPINIIQHPQGRPKEWVVRGNRLILLPELANYRDPKVFAHYEADTMQGSSGAPALSRMWEVFALHHCAVPAIDGQGNILDLDGRPYAGSDDSRVKWIGNEGIRVSALVRHFESERAQVQGRGAKLLDTVLKATRPDYVALAKAACGHHSHQKQTNESSQGVGMAGRIEFKLPLKITIELDGPAEQWVSNTKPATNPDAGQRQGEGPNPGPQSGGSATAAVVSTLPNGLRAQRNEALATLERSRTRLYYDKPADVAERASYYGGISFDTLSAADRFHALNELVESTHATKPRYQPAVQVYPWIDLHKEGRRLVIKSIYSGASFDPAGFIEEAFQIESRRESLRASLTTQEAFGNLNADALELMLEAQAPYNCEHVVPQSWFGKKEPMRGDIHHLFACESGCNSFRGNHAYFDFPEDEAFRDFCGRRENNQFEPGAGKGAAARATLYFLIRYPGVIDVGLSKMDSERIKTLLRWHKGDPVSEYELHRNQAIYEVQGNRNPFIDFPDWAEKVDYSSSL